MERPPEKPSSASSRSRNRMPSFYSGRIEKKLSDTGVCGADNSSVTSGATGGGDSSSFTTTSSEHLRRQINKGKSSGLSRSDMDEAYRRLGHRLSLRVSGKDASSVVPQKARLQATSAGAFVPFVPKSGPPSQIQTPSMLATSGSAPSAMTVSTLSTTATAASQSSSVMDENDGHTHTSAASSGAQASYDRTHKVAKMHLRDHGMHSTSVSGDQSSILKRITCQARDNYRTVTGSNTSSDKTKGKKRSSPNANDPPRSGSPLVSPQRHALSKLALETGSARQRHGEQQKKSSSSSKGLLHAVLEGQAATGSAPSKSPPHMRGKCLTLPSEPAANSGYDNAEGNLIVYQHDILSMHVRKLGTKTKEPVEYKVLGLLGQGTFAQVFKCLDLRNNRMVAVKVVKNRQAYTQQAAIEIDVFHVLRNEEQRSPQRTETTKKKKQDGKMVNLLTYCTFQNHLCLVFELLGLNLYEVLKRRQFRGLPLSTVRSLLQQAMEGIRELSQKSIVHCDLKPENILLTENQQDEEPRSNAVSTKIKLIDFGSACFEGHTAHTYIQSRFYRSPEVLVGLPYDSAIDMWSLGCVAAELYLGLPILPGVHEHDQLGRICEMIGHLPEKMLSEGTKSTKYFVKYVPKSPESTSAATGHSTPRTPSPSTNGNGATSSPPPPGPIWRIKTQQEYIAGLSPEEIRKKGGLQKLQKQPANRYFKRKKLQDIVMMHGGQHMTPKEKEAAGLFVHFLMGILDPDPWNRWTAFQACQHPFITGSKLHRRKPSTTSEGDKKEFDIYWKPPWDPSICRRRLLHVQKTRERQHALRQKAASRHASRDQNVSPGTTGTSRVTAMAETLTLNAAAAKPRSAPQDTLSIPKESGSPPPSIATPGRHQAINSQGVYAPAMMNPVSNAGSLGPTLTPTSMPGGPAYFPAAASSLSDLYQHPGTLVHTGIIPMASPSMHSSISTGLGGDFSMAPQQQMHLTGGAHSFSGLSHDASSLQQLQLEAELGYALQRPGVVPGMGPDVPTTPMMVQQLAGIPAGAFSPQLSVNSLSSNHSLRSGSFSNPPSSSGRSGPRGRRHTFNILNRSSSMESPIVHGGFITSPARTSIREDGAADSFNLGNGNVATQQQQQPQNTASGSTSLLSQQLAAHSAAASASQAPQDPPLSVDHRGVHLQQHMVEGGAPPNAMHGDYGLNPAMYGVQGPATAGVPPQMNLYYMVAPDGTPVLMTPQQTMPMPQVYGSHGSSQEYQVAAAAAAAAAGMMPVPYGAAGTSAPIYPGAMPPGAQLAPHPLAHPSLQEMEQQQHLQQGMPYWSGVVPPQPRQPPPSSYNGTSM